MTWPLVKLLPPYQCSYQLTYPKDEWGCSEIGSDTRDVAHTEELR